MAFSARGIGKEYEHRPVLANVNLGLNPGDKIALVGSNGSGKSTLLRILAGQAQPDEGTVRRVPGIRIGYLPQEPLLPDPTQTVATTVTLGLRRAGLPSVTDEARGWLVRWGLLTRDDLTKRVSDLSVGQQRKVELGILVGSHPDALLLDEPTNHLTFDVIESLQTALADFDGPVLIATHDRRLIREFPRRLWRLHQGRLTATDRNSATA